MITQKCLILVRFDLTKNKIDFESAKNYKFEPKIFEYTDRDVKLYALGVGAKRTDLKWVFEGDDNFSVLPTYGVIAGLSDLRSASGRKVLI